MKKIFSLPLSLLMVLSFCVACQKIDDSQKMPSSQENYQIGAPEYTIPDDDDLDINIDPNGEDYDLDNVIKRKSPLNDKTLYWLGSSVTYGSASNGISMTDYIA